MKKILIINNGPKPLPPVNGGGVETLVQYILEDCSFNFDITIACMFSKEAEVESRKYPNVKFEYLDFNNCLFKIQRAFYYICNHYWGHDIGNALCNLVRRKVDINKYDIIISENGVRLGYSLRKFFKGKLVLHLHNDWLYKDIQYAEQYKHSYDEIWTISKFLKQRVEDINGATPVKVLYNGVDTTLFMPNDQKSRIEARKRYGISPNDIVIANCCRIVEEKGVLETVKVFLDFQKQNPLQHLKLMIIGEISDSNVYHQELMKISNSDIIYTGYISHTELPRVMSCADIGIASTIHLCKYFNDNIYHGVIECFNLTVVEFMSLGIPVIATNSGGMPEILQQDFLNNIIAADEKSFSSELLKCLSKYVKSKEFVYQKGKARQCAERFSKSRYIEMIINYIEQL